MVNPVQFATASTARGIGWSSSWSSREGAEVVGHLQPDFYAGTPAVTRHRFGAGHAWYVGTMLDDAGGDWTRCWAP